MYLYTKILRCVTLSPFPSCHLISRTSSSSLLISLRLFSHVLSCHSSFLLCLSNPPLAPSISLSLPCITPLSSFLTFSLSHSPPPGMIIIGTMMLNQNHGYPGWQICYRGGNRFIILSESLHWRNRHVNRDTKQCMWMKMNEWKKCMCIYVCGHKYTVYVMRKQCN